MKYSVNFLSAILTREIQVIVIVSCTVFVLFHSYNEIIMPLIIEPRKKIEKFSE